MRLCIHGPLLLHNHIHNFCACDKPPCLYSKLSCMLLVSMRLLILQCLFSIGKVSLRTNIHHSNIIMLRNAVAAAVVEV